MRIYEPTNCCHAVNMEIALQLQSGSTESSTMGALEVHRCNNNVTPFTVFYKFLAAPVFEAGGDFVTQAHLRVLSTKFPVLLVGCHSDIGFPSQ